MAVRRIGKDLFADTAIGNLIFALRQSHVGNAGQGRYVLGIYLAKLTDPIKDIVEVADIGFYLCVGYLDTGEPGDTSNGGVIQRHVSRCSRNGRSIFKENPDLSGP